MIVEAVLARSSKRGKEGKKVIGTGFCEAKYERANSSENYGRELSYLFYEDSYVEWVDGRKFLVNVFDIVYTDTIKIVK